MKETDRSIKQKLMGNRPGKIQNFLLALFLLILGTSCAFTQNCKVKAEGKTEAKATTADILLKVANGNHLEKLQAMVEEHGVNINEQLENQETALTLASYHGYAEMVNYLLAHGADVNMKNKWNNNAFSNACMKGHTKIVSMLLKSGADINEKFYYGNTGLCMAIQNGYNETAVFLIENGADVNIANNDNQPPVVLASWRGDPMLMKSMFDKGADANYKTSDGNTILHNLACNANPKSTALALKKGANANIPDAEGRLPLHNAVIRGNTETAKLLLSCTKDINLPEKTMGNTPLHIACINGDLNTASAILEAGANSEIVNSNGKKPVYYAIKYGNTDVVQAFKNKKLATQKDVEMAEKTIKSSTAPILDGQAKVTYTGHSGWIVQTPENILVFDYWDKNLSSNSCLTNGSFCCKEMKNKNVYVFVSHDHSDHFDTTIYSWANNVNNITYIFGFKPEKSSLYENIKYSGPMYHYIQDNQTQTIKDAKITTHKSNDTGQGFFVEIDGVTIYHPGDHALFTDEDKPFFAQEVDFIADIANKVDIAFLPVSGCPSRWKKEFIVEGFFYSIDKLNPQQVYPMHAFNNEYSLKEFAELADQKKTQAQIVCTENRGDSFIYNKNITASK